MERRERRSAGTRSQRALPTARKESRVRHGGTRADYGFRCWRGRASLPPATAARKFRAFAARVALQEFEQARALSAFVVADSLPATMRRVVYLATSTTIDDVKAAHVNLAAARCVLEAGGVIGSRRAAVSVNVAATANAGAAVHNFAAKIAANPEAARLYRELLAIVDPAEG